MTVTAASDAAFVYTDIQGLAGLRNKARQNSPDAAREAAQMTDVRKRGRADAVIVNDGPSDRLNAQIDQLLAGWGFPPVAR